MVETIGNVGGTDGTLTKVLVGELLVPDEAQERPSGWEHRGVSDGLGVRIGIQFGHGGIERVPPWPTSHSFTSSAHGPPP